MATLAELIPQAKALPRTEKQELVQALTEDLFREDDTLRLLLAPGTIEIWTPFDGHEDMTLLHKYLEETSELS
jgi:hypothetical protein